MFHFVTEVEFVRQISYGAMCCKDLEAVSNTSKVELRVGIKVIIEVVQPNDTRSLKQRFTLIRKTNKS